MYVARCGRNPWGGALTPATGAERASHRLAQFPDLQLGVQVLAGANKEAMSVAKAVRARDPQKRSLLNTWPLCRPRSISSESKASCLATWQTKDT